MVYIYLIKIVHNFQPLTRGHSNNMKGAKKIERPGLSDKDIQEIQEAFELFDTDGSGLHRQQN